MSYKTATISYPVNLGALRSLHKLRDGKCIYSNYKMNEILGIAKSSHVDLRYLLYYLALVARSWKNLDSFTPERQMNNLIVWTEISTILDVMSQPESPAYSKPKWMYYFLRAANRNHVIEVLDQLYENNRAKQQMIKIGLLEILEYINKSYPNSEILKGIANDALEIFNYDPKDSFPAIYYLASYYASLTLGTNLLSIDLEKKLWPKWLGYIVSTHLSPEDIIMQQKSVHQLLCQVSRKIISEFHQNKFPQLYPDVLSILDYNAVPAFFTRHQFNDDIKTLTTFQNLYKY